MADKWHRTRGATCSDPFVWVSGWGRTPAVVSLNPASGRDLAWWRSVGYRWWQPLSDDDLIHHCAVASLCDGP